jgi:hypothetical protein
VEVLPRASLLLPPAIVEFAAVASLPPPPPTVAWLCVAVLREPPPITVFPPLAVLKMPPPTAANGPEATLPTPPPTVAAVASVTVAPPLPAWLFCPPPTEPMLSVTRFTLALRPPPEMAAPKTPAVALFPLKPPITFGLLACGSNRNARRSLTRRFSAVSSVVPTKFVAGSVPALPVSFQ